MRQRAYVEILSRREVWRALKRQDRVARLFRALQTSLMLNISTPPLSIELLLTALLTQ